MGCFAQLGFGISQVGHDLPKEFRPDIVFNVFWVEIYYFEDKH